MNSLQPEKAMGLLTYIEKNVFNGKNMSSDKEGSGSKDDSKEGSPTTESSWETWKPILSVVI